MKKFAVLLMVLLITIGISAQEFRIHNTGNATFSIMFASPESGLDVEDQIYGYFTHEGQNYVVGKAHAVPINTNAILTTMMQEGAMPDGSSVPVLDGAPSNTIIKIAAVRGGVAYEVNAGTIHIQPMNTLKPDVKSLPLTLYHLKNVSIDTSKTVELQEVPYFEWYNKQCPKFGYNSMEVRHQAHSIGKNTFNRNDGAVFETNIRRTNREVKLPIGRAQFSKEMIYTVEIGDGKYYSSKREYWLEESDLHRGFVLIRATAVRLPGCLMESNPYREVKILFDTLPRPPRNQTMIVPPGGLPQIPTVELPAPIIHEVLYEDEYVIVGLREYGVNNKDGTRLVVGNKVNKPLTFYLQREDGSTICSGNVSTGKVRYITAYNLSLEKYSDYKKIRYTVFAHKLDKTVTIRE